VRDIGEMLAIFELERKKSEESKREGELLPIAVEKRGIVNLYRQGVDNDREQKKQNQGNKSQVSQ
jgi:hypothetical protein